MGSFLLPKFSINVGYNLYNTGDETPSEESWFVFDGINLLNAAERSDYYTELRKSYQDFLDVLSNQNNKEAGDAQLFQYAYGYRNILEIILFMLDIDNNIALLKTTYIEHGRDVALNALTEQISELETRTQDDPHFVTIVSNINEYLNTQISLLDVYADHSCLVDNVVEISCTLELSENDDQDYLDAFQNQELAYYNFDASFESMKQLFLARTTNLVMMVEEGNAR